MSCSWYWTGCKLSLTLGAVGSRRCSERYGRACVKQALNVWWWRIGQARGTCLAWRKWYDWLRVAPSNQPPSISTWDHAWFASDSKYRDYFVSVLPATEISLLVSVPADFLSHSQPIRHYLTYRVAGILLTYRPRVKRNNSWVISQEYSFWHWLKQDCLYQSIHILLFILFYILIQNE